MLLHLDSIRRPLDVRIARIRRFARRIQTGVGIFIPVGVSIGKGYARTGRMPGGESRGVNLGLADVRLFLRAAVERCLTEQRPSFTEHYKRGGACHHAHLEVGDGCGCVCQPL